MGLPVEIVIKSVWSKSKDKFKSKGIAKLSGSSSGDSNKVCMAIWFGKVKEDIANLSGSLYIYIKYI